MATVTKQDKYVEQKTNEISAMYEAIESLYKRLDTEKSKARGSVAEQEYYYVIDSLKHIVGTAMKYRIAAVKTLIGNNKTFARMK